jgi:hypothetical protein
VSITIACICTSPVASNKPKPHVVTPEMLALANELEAEVEADLQGEIQLRETINSLANLARKLGKDASEKRRKRAVILLGRDPFDGDRY